jgi:hypothetical protein
MTSQIRELERQLQSIDEDIRFETRRKEGYEKALEIRSKKFGEVSKWKNKIYYRSQKVSRLRKERDLLFDKLILLKCVELKRGSLLQDDNTNKQSS